MFKSLCLAALTACASAFSPAAMPARAGSVALNAEMSKSLPFLVKPEKLDGSMAGDYGFDPMGLSEIQTDLKYARWAELKHGRAAMLAIVGILVQEAGIHFPGEQFTETDPFAAIAKVGPAGNLQVLLTIGVIELANFNKHYGDGEPGDLGFDLGMTKGMSPEQLKYRQEQEITHCRLAMIAIVGATVQTLIFHEPLLG